MYPAIFFMHLFQPSTDLMFYMRFFPADSKVFCIKVRIMCDKKDISDEKTLFATHYFDEFFTFIKNTLHVRI
jgi:hypothetical protein